MHQSILVVDDDPLYVDLVREVLATRNIPVISGSNGKAALAVLEKEPVRLIISDVDMPGMDGLAFHEHILADERLKNIPFVFLTGSTDSRVAGYVREKNIRLINKSNLVFDLLSLISAVL